MRLGVLIAAVAALLAPASAHAARVSVVVRLDSPGLAEATATSRVLGRAARSRRLDPASPTSRSYLESIAASQSAFEARLARVLPGARVYRRYRIVFNGLAVALPARDLPRLERLGDVYSGTAFRPHLDRSVPMIGANAFWSAPGVGAGEGAKIAILDDGLDQSHPFFSPAGYTMPPGFPKGRTTHTTAKVIVARAFPPRGLAWRNAAEPFDPVLSSHATHVAGIAAGNAGTLGPDGVRLAGVAPRAYLGNYKVLTYPTENFGLNGNAPEIAAGVEAAVADGMDVINLSLGQPEIEPTRDILALAIEGAARAGVPTVAAAGNEYSRFRAGSVSSPAGAASAIAVASVTTTRSGPGGAVSSFSSAGPSPVSLRLKPDVAAPGADVLSSQPEGEWGLLSGTSMAAPHVTGAVALLRRRHPTWTPAQLRSALASTAAPTGSDNPLRTGGGLVNVVRADAPLVFSEPSSIAFGIVRPGETARATVALADAGGGAGRWEATVVTSAGASIGTSSVDVPGQLAVTVPAGRVERDETGFVVLHRGADVRRIPYWLRVATPDLPRPTRTLARAGTYRGSTVGRPARVQTYRYPEGLAAPQRGPEQVFRVVVRRPVANFGVAVLSGGVQPRVVFAGDENRLVGIPGLPLNINPYVEAFGAARPIAGAIRPAAGSYDVVFDSRRRGSPFRFRFWVDDVRPPSARLLDRVSRAGAVRVRVADAGSGVDPRSIEATVGGRQRPVRVAGGVASVDVRGVRRGSYALTFAVADHQEAKNMENVASILPNTRVLRARVTVR